MPISFFFTKDAFPAFTKRDVDTCSLKDDLVTICNELRSVFFLSKVMRKERNALFYFERERLVIWFCGASLRYLGPDERSMLMLVLKAWENASEKARRDANYQPGKQPSKKWIESTPGICFTNAPSCKDAAGLFTGLHPDYQPATVTTMVQGERNEKHAIQYPEGLGQSMRSGLAVFFPRAPCSDDGTDDRLDEMILTFTISTRSKIKDFSNVVLLLNLLEDNST